jgi:hypothetical protein
MDEDMPPWLHECAPDIFKHQATCRALEEIRKSELAWWATGPLAAFVRIAGGQNR